jgi:hypothetical protein
MRSLSGSSPLQDESAKKWGRGCKVRGREGSSIPSTYRVAISRTSPGFLQTPCYHGYVGDPRFYLVYAVELFRSIAQAAVDSIENYVLEKQLDPYARLPDTSRWCE